MIDVALKVGELKGGMAEGSVTTFQTNDEPLSKHMKTVFAMLRVEEDQLSLIHEAMHSRKRSPRRFRIPLRALSHALSRPDLERQWRSREAVEPVNVSRLDLRKLMKRGYKVRKPKHPDLNVVSSGRYTVGKQADYIDWNAVLSDISTTITGTLIFIQISDLSYFMAGITGLISLNSPTAKIIFKSASILMGNGGQGLETEDTTRSDNGFRLNIKTSAGNETAYVEMKDLYFRVASGASPAFDTNLVEVIGLNGSEKTTFKIHDCIFYGNSKLGHGFAREDDYTILQLWNCKFGRFTSGRGISLTAAAGADSFIENCIVEGNDYGIYQSTTSSVKVNNCVGIDNTTADFEIVTPQATDGDNNVSSDATAGDFNGTDNLASQSTLNAEFVNTSYPPTTAGFYRLKSTATILPAAGKAPEIPDNTAGSKGNSRPGTDGEYSAGADELSEVFPNDWNVYTDLVLNSEKVAGSGAFLMPVLITEKAFMITDEIWNNSRDDGGDLRLVQTSVSETTLLPLEVVTWDRANRKCELWAKVIADPSTDQEFRLWCGNPNATQLEYNDSESGRGRFYIWQNISSVQGFVYHCANDPDERYLYDSSPAKMHAPVASGALTQIDSPFGYGKAVEFDESSTEYVDFGVNKYEFTKTAQDGFAVMHVKKITATGGSLMRFDRNGGTSRRVDLKDQGAPQGFTVTAAAPDGGALQTHFSNGSLSDLASHVLGAWIDLGAKDIHSWVDGVKASSTGLGFGASFFSSGTHDRALIGQEVGGADMHFYAQEIRYWNTDYFSASDEDKFWETHHTMVTEQAAFWSCGELHGQAQEGFRKWQFLVPEVGCYGVENTDFWVEYTANLDGTLGVILHAVWDAGSGDALTSVAKRVELEEHLEELRHTFETLRGDLLIDAGTAFEKLIRGVQLSSVSLNEGKTNAALDYNLTFILGLAGIGMNSIARKLEFAGSILTAGNFLVEYVGADRTVFKEVFRAASIRVPSGPSDKSVFVSAIVESISASTSLGRRQKSEEIVKTWSWDRLGTAGELKIDDESLGTAHLASVQPSNLELPDAVVFDLEFITGYGE